jgi:hypothetical protein
MLKFPRGNPPGDAGRMAHGVASRSRAARGTSWRVAGKSALAGMGVVAPGAGPGSAPLARVALISESVTTLQEQTIIEVPSMKPRDEPENGYLTRCLSCADATLPPTALSGARVSANGARLLE